MKLNLAVALLLLVLLLLTPLAHGAEKEIYQDTLLSDALEVNHLEIEPSPAGKTIERTVIASYNIFSKGDPWPGFLESVHYKTDEQKIRQELLFENGEMWSQEAIDETARNLRNYLFLAVAEVFPCKSENPGHVQVLIVTKDLWSLRLNNSFSFVNSSLEILDFELAEFNLGGKNRKVGTTFRRDLAAFSTGLEYLDPRLAGSRVAFSESAKLSFNRDTQKLEGGSESLEVYQPLYSLRTKWAWNTKITYTKDIYRLFSNGQIAQVKNSTTGETLPYSFGRELFDAQASLTRSYGYETKRNLSFGWKGYSRNFSDPQAAVQAQPQTLQAFRTSTEPRSERAGMLFLGFHQYEPRYLRVEDINTYALIEDFRLGLELRAEARIAEPLFGFNSHFFEPRSQASYTWSLGDDILTVGGLLNARYQNDVSPTTSWLNTTEAIEATNVSPRFWILRNHFHAKIESRQNNLNHEVTTLGSDGELRGYPSAYFIGPHVWVSNIEMRTLPVEFQTVYIGAASFIDLGDAFGNGKPVGIHASTGLGLRVLFPQFNRAVLRLDAGFALDTTSGLSPVSVVAQFGQVFQ